jgi:hypothetical protein
MGVTAEPRHSGLLLHQRQYTLDNLERAQMSDCKPCSKVIKALRRDVATDPLPNA